MFWTGPSRDVVFSRAHNQRACVGEVYVIIEDHERRPAAGLQVVWVVVASLH